MVRGQFYENKFFHIPGLFSLQLKVNNCTIQVADYMIRSDWDFKSAK